MKALKNVEKIRNDSDNVPEAMSCLEVVVGAPCREEASFLRKI